MLRVTRVADAEHSGVEERAVENVAPGSSYRCESVALARRDGTPETNSELRLPFLEIVWYDYVNNRNKGNRKWP